MKVFNFRSTLFLSTLIILFSLCAYSQIEVWTAADLDSVRNNLDGDYIQMADIDLSGFDNWMPIGTEGSEFTGTYDGNGYTISNLTANRPDMNYVGLFGRVLEAELKNISLVNIDVTGGTWTGGLTGWSRGLIENVYVSGNVTGNFSVGGIVGFNSQGDIYNCRTEGSVTANNMYAGGMVGYHSESNLYESYSTASISGGSYIGGVVGRNQPLSLITDSYATGTVTGNQYIGGLVGRNWNSSIVNSYATGQVTGNTDVGGLVGGEFGGAVTENSYWDTETTGQTISAGGEGRTTDEMTYPYDEDTYVDWDFNEIWASDTDYWINNGYPYLQWQPISLPLPDQVVLDYPEDEAIIEPHEPYEIQMGWYASQPEVTNYQLDIARDEEFTDIVFTDDAITDTFYVFSYEDDAVYYWRVRAVNAAGWGDYSDVWSFIILINFTEENGEIPAVHTLLQNYPNPFNPSTVIRYGLSSRSIVKLEIYNTLGQRVATLVEEELEAGYHEIEWYAGRVTSGVYFYRLEAVSTDNSSEHFVETKSMVVLK